MNIERLRAVRNAILNPPRGYGFKMTAFASKNHPCGTTFCIGGWAAHLAGYALGDGKVSDHLMASLLGLNEEQANELFFPSVDAGWRSTPAQAADTIDHLIATGEVVWETAPTERPQ